MVGIYKITSPSGKVDIGQSWNIKKRHYYYASANCKEQPLLYRSLKKYGYSNHICENVITFPEDITQSILDAYKIFVIDQFLESFAPLLNAKPGGGNAKLSAESRKKISDKRKLRTIQPGSGKKRSPETIEKIRAANLGRKQVPEAIEKSRKANIGRKASEETKGKLRAARAINNIWVGRKHSEESRLKQSEKKIGNKINNKKCKRIDTGHVFESVTAAAESIGIPMKTLSARIKAGSRKNPQFSYDV